MALQAAAHRAARGVGIPVVCVQMLPATLAGPIMRNRTAVSCIHRGARRRAYSSVVPGAFPNHPYSPVVRKPPWPLSDSLSLSSLSPSLSSSAWRSLCSLNVLSARSTLCAQAKSTGTAEYEQLRTNWGECVPFRHRALASPADLTELQEVGPTTFPSPTHSLVHN